MSDSSRTSPPDRKGRSRERNVNLLKYYGISGSAAGDNRQPLDIDSDTFEPNKYFSRLLKEKTLSVLSNATMSWWQRFARLTAI